MMDNGVLIFRMEGENRHGLSSGKRQAIKGNLLKEKNMGRGDIYAEISGSTKVIFLIMKSLALREKSNIGMVRSILGILKMGKKMALGFISGQMAQFFRVGMLMIKNKVMGNLEQLIINCLKVSGKMENDKEKVLYL
jgi:hypothetical protein